VWCRGHMDGKVGMAGSNQFGHQSGMGWMAACACQDGALVVICGPGEEARMGEVLSQGEKWRWQPGKIFGQSCVGRGASGMVQQVQWLDRVVEIWKVWNRCWEAGQVKVKGSEPVGWRVEVAQKAGYATLFQLGEGKYLIGRNQVTRICGFGQGVGGRAEGGGGWQRPTRGLGCWGTVTGGVTAKNQGREASGARRGAV